MFGAVTRICRCACTIRMDEIPLFQMPGRGIPMPSLLSDN